MILVDDVLVIYIFVGLVGFFVVLWCCVIIVCKGFCWLFDELVKLLFDMYMDLVLRNMVLWNKYDVY